MRIKKGREGKGRKRRGGKTQGRGRRRREGGERGEMTTRTRILRIGGEGFF